jgi:hypothetical protein
MRFALLVPVLICLLVTPAPASDSEPMPGRSGDYEFDAISLIGTVWEGKIVYDDTSLIRFDPNGVLRIRYFQGTTMQANWKQQGDRIVIEINNKYVECEGFLRDGRLVGKAKNKAPTNWNWEMKRRPASDGSIFGAPK